MLVILKVNCRRCWTALQVHVSTDQYEFNSRIATQELEVELSDAGWETKHKPREQRVYTCPKCKEPPKMEIKITESELRDALRVGVKFCYEDKSRKDAFTFEEVANYLVNTILESECSYTRIED